MTMTNQNRTSTLYRGNPKQEANVEKVRAAMNKGLSEKQGAKSLGLVGLAHKSIVFLLTALLGLYWPLVTQADSLYFVHTDHLGTPQIVTDENQQKVWEGQQRPFGETEVVTSQTEFNVRFPGQYYDAETGLHYNWNRYYHPGLGRYLQSDPIGLGGGLNTYGYADQNPTIFIDPLGLYTLILGPRGITITPPMS
ncbi:hypothetical protein FT643_14365 [Ketobacter sp. MCCC 1A13808]|nr:hypothetical protein [Ketobacter sp. MCCC 1A13808]